MLEFLRVLGLVLACTGLILSVAIFVKFKIPSVIIYFTGSENRRIKEYQKQQKEYLKGTKASSNLKNANNNFIGDETETLDTSDEEFTTALLCDPSTTTLLDDSETEILGFVDTSLSI